MNQESDAKKLYIDLKDAESNIIMVLLTLVFGTYLPTKEEEAKEN